jgi:hypothetical protein
MRHADAVVGGADNGRDFPGANRLDVNGSAPQITGTRITLSAWALTDSGANNYLVARFNGNPATSSYAMGCNPVIGLFHDGATQDALNTGVQTFPQGGAKLHHWCVTKDNTTARGYVDGKIDCHIASTVSLANAGSPCVGDAALALPYNGVIRHVAVWDEALTPWEVMQLAQGVAPWDVRGAKLRVWLPLSSWEGGTGNARDLSVFNNTATPAGGTTYALRPAESAPRPHDPLKILLEQIGGAYFSPLFLTTQRVVA